MTPGVNEAAPAGNTPADAKITAAAALPLAALIAGLIALFDRLHFWLPWPSFLPALLGIAMSAIAIALGGWSWRRIGEHRQRLGWLRYVAHAGSLCGVVALLTPWYLTELSPPPRILSDTCSEASAGVLTPDGKRVIFGCDSDIGDTQAARLEVHSVASSDAVQVIPLPPSRRVERIVPARDGRTLFAYTDEEILRIDSIAGTVRKLVPQHSTAQRRESDRDVPLLRLSPGGKTLLCRVLTGLALYDVESGAVKKEFGYHTASKDAGTVVIIAGTKTPPASILRSATTLSSRW
jgi:hypothetical protein